MGATLIEPYNAYVTAGIVALGMTTYPHMGMSDLGRVKGDFCPLSRPNCTPPKYTNWAEKSTTAGSTENCGVLHMSSGQWGDGTCTTLRPIFCQKFKHFF